MKSVIILIPLDSRPVNYLLPAEIASISGYPVLRPPQKILGDLNKSADTSSVSAWLRDAAEKYPEAAIVASSDMLAYGGLIWSRKNLVSFSQAKKNIKVIQSAAVKSGRRNIFVFSTIPRDAATVHGGSDFNEWRRQMKGASANASAERNRNIEIIGELLEMTQNGAIDYLMVGKEDTAENNPFASEITAIEKRIRAKLAERAGIAAGADELGCMLCARAIAGQAGKKIYISVNYSGVSPGFVPMYEPFPIEKTIAAQIRCAGAEIEKKGNSNNRVVIHGADKREDLFLTQLSGEYSKTTIDSTVAATVKMVEKLLYQEVNVGVADIRYMNGSSEALVSKLLEKRLYFRLGAYAGWNTSANSTGNVIAQIVSTACANGGSLESGNRVEATFQRLVEDYAYSCEVRGKLAELTKDPTGKQGEKMHQSAKVMMNDMAGRIGKRSEGQPCDASGNLKIRGAVLKTASLPWRRIFEVKTTCEVELM